MKVHQTSVVQESQDVVDEERRLSDLRNAIEVADKQLSQKNTDLLVSKDLDDKLVAQKKEFDDNETALTVQRETSKKNESEITAQEGVIEANNTVISTQKQTIETTKIEVESITTALESAKNAHTVSKQTAGALEARISDLNKVISEAQKQATDLDIAGKENTRLANLAVTEATDKLAEIKKDILKAKSDYEIEKTRLAKVAEVEQKPYAENLKTILANIEVAKQRLIDANVEVDKVAQKKSEHELAIEESTANQMKITNEIATKNKNLDDKRAILQQREDTVNELHRRAIVDIAKKAKENKVKADQTLVDEILNTK